jgi:O-antigen ligase
MSFLQRFAVGSVIVCVVAAAPFAIPQSAKDRLATIPEEIRGGAMSGRRNLWRSSYESFLEHPYLGIGWGGHMRIKLKYSRSDEGKVAHNVYLSVLAETGIVGFVLYFSVLGICVYRLKELPPLERNLWIVLCLTWAIGAASITWDVRKVTWILFGLLSVQTAVPRIRATIGYAGAPAPRMRPERELSRAGAAGSEASG